jgi:hypothetical protein
MGKIADYGSRDALGLAELVRTKQVSALEEARPWRERKAVMDAGSERAA